MEAKGRDRRAHRHEAPAVIALAVKIDREASAVFVHERFLDAHVVLGADIGECPPPPKSALSIRSPPRSVNTVAGDGPK